MCVHVYVHVYACTRVFAVCEYVCVRYLYGCDMGVICVVMMAVTFRSLDTGYSAESLTAVVSGIISSALACG